MAGPTGFFSEEYKEKIINKLREKEKEIHSRVLSFFSFSVICDSSSPCWKNKKKEKGLEKPLVFTYSVKSEAVEK